MSAAKALPFFFLAGAAFYSMHILTFGGNPDAMAASSAAKKQYSEGARSLHPRV